MGRLLLKNISRLKFWHSYLKKFFSVNAFKIQYYSKRSVFRFFKRLPSLKRVYLNAFPAIQIKPLDWYDYILRFSSELLVLILALGISGLNLFHFYLAEDVSDKSFAAKFLSYHPRLNPELYQKNSVISTQIVNANGFVHLAQAEDFGILPTVDLAENPEGLEEDQNFQGDVIVQPAVDTLESLVAKQIKIYQTQKGDTLDSIAKANGISLNTITWANKLTSQTIQPGWFLVILPTDGVLHKATRNNTLPDIAKKYSGDLETIIAYNGLENAEDIDEGQMIIIPNGRIPDAPRPKALATRDPSKVKPQGAVKPKIVNNGTGHLFPWGYCTWYLATKVHIPWGGNAKNWLANAKAYGAVIGSEPAIGAIVVTTDNRRYGHVAYIESLDQGGFTVSEMNYEKFGKVNTRWIPTGSKIIRGYIYP
ncbi:MAG: LysM peptidoglycan-binding domain-containing protein [Candidatus Doudnabacteria bacterium]|nr:LysM peptidoglycan-binding domain-containing protein [Candidatus Doudnabacteria bacterium]